jgi:uncharacterized protein (TIGR03382 family)
MNCPLSALLPALLTGLLLPGGAQAQYSGNIVGYVNHSFVAGSNLFANPLQASANTLSGLFNPGFTPAGTTVSLWDALTAGYNLTSTFNGTSWSVNLTLNPGTGALLTTPTPFINTFVGTVLGLTSGGVVQVPAEFAGPPGTYLLAPIAPITLDVNYPAFQYVLGRAPRHGEAFTWLDKNSQTWHTTTYSLLTDDWDNGVATLAVGDAAFFTVQPIPEPGVVPLLLLGVAWLFRRRR